jgi:hypothetical protein
MAVSRSMAIRMEDLEKEPADEDQSKAEAGKDKAAGPEDSATTEAADTASAVETASGTIDTSEVIANFLKSGPVWQQKLYLNSVERRSSQDLVRLDGG